MTQVVKIIKSLFDLVTGIFDFVIDFFADIIKMVGLLAKSVANLPTILGMFLPEALITIIIALVGVTVLYRVLGRD